MFNKERREKKEEEEIQNECATGMSLIDYN